MTRLNALSFALLAVCAGLTPPVLAARPGGVYLGGAVGSVSNDYGAGKCNDDAIDVRLYIYAQQGVYTECAVASGGNGFKLFFGHFITTNFALEFAYANLGKMTASFKDYSSGSVLNSIEQKTSAVTLDGVGVFALGNGVGLSGKIGIYRASQTSSDDLNDFSNSRQGSGLNIGVAGSYALNPDWSARLEFERYCDVGSTNITDNFYNYVAPTFKTNIDLVSLGLVYHY